jgi:hypothetical protein
MFNSKPVQDLSTLENGMNQIENRLMSFETGLDNLESTVSNLESILDCKLDAIESNIETLESTFNNIDSTIDNRVTDCLKELKILLIEQTLINSGWKELSNNKWFAPNENQYSHLGEDLECAYFSLKSGYSFTHENPALKKLKKHLLKEQND